MAGFKPLVLGTEGEFRGDVTRNSGVSARSARALERSLGFAPGRLDAGWAVLLLKQALIPDDFKFSGLTLRSGGRAGLPAASWAADRARMHVHDEMLNEIGAEAYRDRQRRMLSSITGTGLDRLVKVIPTTPHSDDLAPDVQYPMGGGGLQWTLIRSCRFLIAMTVDANGIARIPGFSAYLGESATYEDRARLARYLNEA